LFSDLADCACEPVDDGRRWDVARSELLLRSAAGVARIADRPVSA
jgi:hypothetical protein